jgi:hypothetical protein
VIVHEVLHTLRPQAADASAEVTHGHEAVEQEADAFAAGFARGNHDRVTQEPKGGDEGAEPEDKAYAGTQPAVPGKVGSSGTP